jgi:hypothetical protein
MNVTTSFTSSTRLWARLHEKSGKFHEMNTSSALDLAKRGVIFPCSRPSRFAPYGRGQAERTGERFHRGAILTSARKFDRMIAPNWNPSRSVQRQRRSYSTLP